LGRCLGSCRCLRKSDGLRPIQCLEGVPHIDPSAVRVGRRAQYSADFFEGGVEAWSNMLRTRHRDNLASILFFSSRLIPQKPHRRRPPSRRGIISAADLLLADTALQTDKSRTRLLPSQLRSRRLPGILIRSASYSFQRRDSPGQATLPASTSCAGSEQERETSNPFHTFRELAERRSFRSF
jgi:hypothetical protein